MQYKFFLKKLMLFTQSRLTKIFLKKIVQKNSSQTMLLFINTRKAKGVNWRFYIDFYFITPDRKVTETWNFVTFHIFMSPLITESHENVWALV